MISPTTKNKKRNSIECLYSMWSEPDIYVGLVFKLMEYNKYFNVNTAESNFN